MYQPTPAELTDAYTVLGFLFGLGHLIATRDFLASGEFVLTSIGAMCVFHAVLGLMVASGKN